MIASYEDTGRVWIGERPKGREMAPLFIKARDIGTIRNVF